MPEFIIHIEGIAMTRSNDRRVEKWKMSANSMSEILSDDGEIKSIFLLHFSSKETRTTTSEFLFYYLVERTVVDKLKIHTPQTHRSHHSTNDKDEVYAL